MGIDCAICLDVIQCKVSMKNKCILPRRSKIPTKLLTCNHAFHSKCIKKWWYVGTNWSTCPCCRTPIQFNNVSKTYNYLLMTQKLTKVYHECIDEEDDYMYKFLYFDHASALLDMYHPLPNAIHFAFWAVQGKLKKIHGRDTPL